MEKVDEISFVIFAKYKIELSLVRDSIVFLGDSASFSSMIFSNVEIQACRISHRQIVQFVTFG